MSLPALAAPDSSETAPYQPLGAGELLASRQPAPGARSLLRSHGASEEQRRRGDDRGAAALKQARRTVELLRGLVTRLEAAIGNRDFQTARWLAASLRTTAPGLPSSLDEARRRGADPAALAAVQRRALELSPRLEAALARAPKSARGLGFDLLDPEGEERLEQTWLAQLEGEAPAQPGARRGRSDGANRQGSPGANVRGSGEDHGDAAPALGLGATGSPTPPGYELIPTASPAPTLRARRDEMFAAFAALQQRIAARLAAAAQLGAHTAGRAAYSAHVLGKSLEVRHHEATAELNALRFAVAAGDIDGARLERLAERLSRLDFETTLLAQIGSLGQIFSLLDELENDRWVLFVEGLMGSDSEQTYFGEGGGRIGRLEAMRRGAAALKGGLATLHSRWLKIERLAQLVERGGTGAESGAPAAEPAGGSGAASRGQAQPPGALTGLVQRAQVRLLEEEFASLRRLAATLGNDDNVRAFLDEALRTARSAQARAMIAQLAAMLGVLLAASAAAAATGGLAAGAGAGKAATFLAGAATESAVFTTLTARLSNEGLGPKLLTDFGENLATFGALRLVRGFVAASAVGKTLAAGPEASSRGVYLAAKLADVSATSLTVAASQLALSEARSLATQGRLLSEDELHQLAIQGLAMMIAGSLLHRGIFASNEQLAAAAAGLGRRLRNAAALRATSARLAAHGDPAETTRLLAETRTYLEQKLALTRELAARSPAELQKLGLTPEMARELVAADTAHLADLGRLERVGAGTGVTRRVRRTRPSQVPLEKLHDLRQLYVAGPGQVSEYAYDPRTRTVSFETEINGLRGRFETQLPRPITRAGDWSQPNRIIGTKHLPSEAAATEILRQVSAGDLDVFRQLGAEVPEDLATQLRGGLEFGLGELPNGHFVIIRGNTGEVEWHTTLPGIKARAHTHPSVKRNDLFADETGQPRVSLRKLVAPTAERLVARELVLPSIPDIQFLAEHKIARHRVLTPFIIQGAHVMKPTSEQRAVPRLEFEVTNAIDTGQRTRSGTTIYRADVTGYVDGKEVLRARVRAIPESHDNDPASPSGIHVEAGAEN